MNGARQLNVNIRGNNLYGSLQHFFLSPGVYLKNKNKNSTAALDTVSYYLRLK